MAKGSGYNFNVSSEALSEGKISLTQPLSVMFITEGVGTGIQSSQPNSGDTLPNITHYTEVVGTGYQKKALLSQAVSRGSNTATNTQSATPFTGDYKWDSDPAGPTDIRTALLYVDATGECLAFWDLTSDGGTTAISLAAGPISLNFGSGSGVIYRAIAANTI